MKIKRALISVSNKDGIAAFAGELTKLGVEIVSTGGTFKAIKEAGVPVKYVSDITGFPEILDGRVKTLHPNVHGGILAMRTEEHLNQLKEQGIEPIDMVVVNLYPFRETIAKPGVTLADAIENIDIGGPAMVRAAAKNNKDVVILVNPDNYEEVLTQLKENKDVSQETRLTLAREAYGHTASYDAAITNYLAGVEESEEQFTDELAVSFTKVQDCRYGENPHQKAAFYKDTKVTGGCVGSAKQLQGKALSFNNIMDVNSAFELVREFEEPATVIVKHNNPSGTAVDTKLVNAYKKAHDVDPVSAFGGIIGVNTTLDKETADEIVKTFIEAIIAPEVTEEALEVLKTKENLRVLVTGSMDANAGMDWDIKKVNGGLLVQDVDRGQVDMDDIKVASDRKPTDKELEELLFAWKIVKHVKSNAILITKDKCTIGVGAGQMNRVGSAKIAVEQAGENIHGAALASDAFFPFRDTIDTVAKAGVGAIIQPGGSMRDEESIKAANEHGIVLVFTGMRHFKH